MPKKIVDYTHPNFNIPPKRKYRTHNWTRDLCLGENKLDEGAKARKQFYESTARQRKTSAKRSYSE